MTKHVEAVYENGVLRPVRPIELPEGQSVDLIVITRDANHPGDNGRGDLRRLFGAVSLGHPTGADNEVIDQNLADEYGKTHQERS